MRKAASVLGLLVALSIHASSPELVFDVFTGTRPESSNPMRFFSTGQHAYFFANDGSGAELWITDGTAAGTYRLAELTPGPDDDYPDDDTGGFTRSGDLVWFWYADPYRDDQVALWRTDGTRNGTFRVARDAAYYAAELVPVGARGIIARTSDGFVVSDGTVEGTLRFGDAPPLILDGGFDGASMVPFRGSVYFVQSRELWRTDGTAAGTKKVADFPEDLGGVLQVVAADDAIYIAGSSATESDTSYLFRSEGGSPALVATLKGEYDDAPRLIVNNGVAYALAGVDEKLTELYRLGTTAQRVTVVEGNTHRSTLIQSSGGAIWFETEQPYLLWRSDGTAAGTRVFEGVGTDAALVIDRTRVFMLNYDGVFVSDGKTATRLTAMSPRTYDEPAAMVADRLVMAVEDSVHGLELWVTDGTANGTRLLKNIRADRGSDATFLRRAGDELIFGASTYEEGLEPWITDGTLFNTRLLADIERGPWSSNPHAVTTLPNGKTVFIAGQHLYGTNGNLTELLRVTGDDIYMGEDGTPGQPLPVIGGRAWVIYSGDEDELWATDGTRAGTTKLVTLPHRRNESLFVATSRYLFFLADDALWRTDGTDAGTFALASEPEQIQAAGDKVFFIAWTTAFGRELWVTDGTLAGTHVVKDIRRGKEDAFLNRWWDDNVNPMHAAGGRLFFAADDGVHGFEPWISDGTEEGTFLLRDVAPGEESSMVSMFDEELAAFADGAVYFAADDGVYGRELWRSDLRTAELLRDICPGMCSSSPEHLRAIDDAVYLSADDGVHGRELWFANAATARFVADVNRGPDSSDPREMTELDGAIYFFATTEQYGEELWRIRTPKPRRRAVR
ncbi:MAG TPA: hypothetical protein VNI54_01230 [Thermoanaerobaculia bacterium]|nr:hypothetical protein [Thermoanaerobaculia bacterium]